MVWMCDVNETLRQLLCEKAFYDLSDYGLNANFQIACLSVIHNSAQISLYFFKTVKYSLIDKILHTGRGELQRVGIISY